MFYSHRLCSAGKEGAAAKEGPILTAQGEDRARGPATNSDSSFSPFVVHACKRYRVRYMHTDSSTNGSSGSLVFVFHSGAAAIHPLSPPAVCLLILAEFCCRQRKGSVTAPFKKTNS